jgi:hypothetical protein
MMAVIAVVTKYTPVTVQKCVYFTMHGYTGAAAAAVQWVVRQTTCNVVPGNCLNPAAAAAAAAVRCIVQFSSRTFHNLAPDLDDAAAAET